ncbi:MAG: DUF418 domain-containing protein [Bacteroidales bacterium]|nr:DUF418 domain-containing protein [Bacteroidales bacterium]
METAKTIIKATSPEQRIISLDLLRGFAVLGILIMNIQSFSAIGAAYINPTAYGDLTGLNKWIWILSELFADSKFMSIFSMLFGVGIIIFTERALKKGRRAGRLHYRRNFWLFLFGMVHAYLIWYGDILVAYSLCAFLAFVFRKLKPKTLLIYSVLFFIVPIIFTVGSGLSIEYWPEETYNQNKQTWIPDAATIDTEMAAMRGNWIEQMDIRIPGAIFLQTFLFFWQTFWRVMSMMLLGMVLYKWGVMSAEKSKSFYLKMGIISLSLGYLFTGTGIIQNFNHNWSMDYSMFAGSMFNYTGSIGVALGYIALVMFFVKSTFGRVLKYMLISVGRMAFTNYILMSIICTFIFYGHGFGLFGKIERTGQILIVLAVWIIILVISHSWLKKFQYGPLEWLWRVLTYWQKQPMKKQ